MSEVLHRGGEPDLERLGLDPINLERFADAEIVTVSPTHRAGNLLESETLAHDFGFFVIPERARLPKEVVKHLKAMSQLPQFKAWVGEDRYKFDEPRLGRVSKRFTRDEGGRRLYGAIDVESGMLAGYTSRHPLKEDKSGSDIVAAVRAHNIEAQNPTSNADMIDIEHAITSAVRVHPYFQHTGLLTQLLLRGPEEYKAIHPEVTHEVTRIPGNDVLGPLIENPRIRERWSAGLLLGAEALLASNVFYGVYDLNHGVNDEQITSV